MDGLKPNGDMDGGSVYGFVYMFSFSYVLDVDVGSQKRGGYICLYIAKFVIEKQGGIYVFIYVYVCMSRGLHISYLIARW